MKKAVSELSSEGALRDLRLRSENPFRMDGDTAERFRNVAVGQRSATHGTRTQLNQRPRRGRTLAKTTQDTSDRKRFLQLQGFAQAPHETKVSDDALSDLQYSWRRSPGPLD